MPRCRVPRPLTASGALAAIAAILVLGAGPAAAADCKGGGGPNTDWQGCDKSMLMLGGSDLRGANLSGTDFTSTDLGGVDLAGANLEKATLTHASLAGAKAEKASFVHAEAYRTNFAGISASGALFTSAELERADFSKAELTAADFSKAELGRASFVGATITGTKFDLSNLSRVEFKDVVFKGPISFDRAFLYLTRIEGLDLSAATGLAQWQVDLTCGDDQTKLPAGLTVPKTWPCKFVND
jgi:uncharacterized protein YjbI with pentapeptide repeats